MIAQGRRLKADGWITGKNGCTGSAGCSRFWLFALGSIVGSFLNVVVYRLPRGQNLAYPGSRCPACGHPIRWYHNLPVVSWILLRGRCHDCPAKIAARYPLVELTSALLFVGLAWLEVWAPSSRLPPLTGQELVARWAYHLWLLETLLAVALIERDGLRVPRRLLCMALAIGIIGAAAFPGVQASFARVTPAEWHLTRRWVAVIQAVAGGTMGLLAWWVYALARKEVVAKATTDEQREALDPVGQVPSGRRDLRGGLRRRVSGLAGDCVGRVSGHGGLVAVGCRANKRGRKKGSADARWGWSGPLFLASLVWLIAARLWIDFLPVWLP